MRTNLDIDDELLRKAARYAKVTTKKAVVTQALEEFVIAHERQDLRELRGIGGISADYDHRAMRERGASG